MKSLTRVGAIHVIIIAVLPAALAMPSCRGAPEGTALAVSAASSLQRVLPELAAAFTRQDGTAVSQSFAASGTIAAQIVAGAPVDFFLSADRESVERLASRGLVTDAAPYAAGTLALVACPGGAAAPAAVDRLAGPQFRRIGLANPALAPYGRAGREALERAGVWDAVQPKVILGENAGVVRQHCSTGNVDAAFLPRALVDGPAASVLALAEGSHAPMEHWFAIPGSSSRAGAARRFAAFLAGPAAREILARHGLAPPKKVGP